MQNRVNVCRRELAVNQSAPVWGGTDAPTSAFREVLETPRGWPSCGVESPVLLQSSDNLLLFLAVAFPWAFPVLLGSVGTSAVCWLCWHGDTRVRCAPARG